MVENNQEKTTLRSAGYAAFADQRYPRQARFHQRTVIRAQPDAVIHAGDFEFCDDDPDGTAAIVEIIASD